MRADINAFGASDEESEGDGSKEEGAEDEEGDEEVVRHGRSVGNLCVRGCRVGLSMLGRVELGCLWKTCGAGEDTGVGKLASSCNVILWGDFRNLRWIRVLRLVGWIMV